MLEINPPIESAKESHLLTGGSSTGASNLGSSGSIGSIEIDIVPNEKLRFDLKDYIGEIPEQFRMIIDYLCRPQEYIVDPTMKFNSLLLYGPPGTCKSKLTEALARATGRDLIKCSAAQLMTKWQASGSENVKLLFRKSQEHNKPVILFLDEIDTVTSDRSQEKNKEYQNTLMTITANMDKLLEDHKDSVPLFFVAATNHSDNLDQALSSRFSSKRIELKLPNNHERMLMLQTLFEKVGCVPSGRLRETLIQETNEFSGRNIFDIFSTAHALRTYEKCSQLRLDHFRQAIDRIRETINKQKEIEREKQLDKNLKYWQYSGARAGTLSNPVGIATTAYDELPTELRQDVGNKLTNVKTAAQNGLSLAHLWFKQL